MWDHLGSASEQMAGLPDPRDYLFRSIYSKLLDWSDPAQYFWSSAQMDQCCRRYYGFQGNDHACSDAGAFHVCKYTRQVRNAVLEELRQDYVIGARMRGIKESVILWRHVLPNAMLPIVTLLGLSLGSLLGGTAVVEIIYNWPGMGSMAIKAISCRDYPMVQAYVLVIAILYMVINIIVDLSYTYLDPRIKEVK